MERHAIQITDETNVGQFALLKESDLTYAAKTTLSRVTIALQIARAQIAQYQSFKDDTIITRILLKTNIDSLMRTIYVEYNCLADETKFRRVLKRKHHQTYTYEHYQYVDQSWLFLEHNEQYFSHSDFGANVFNVVEDWDPNAQSDVISSVVTVPRVLKPTQFGDNVPTVVLSAMDAYNHHMTQYSRLYLLWKRYLYPKEALGVPIKYHMEKIMEHFNSANSVSQQPFITQTSNRSTTYPLGQIKWTELQISSLYTIMPTSRPVVDINYPLLVETITKPVFIPQEYTYVQQGRHHDQSLVRCLVMALGGIPQRDYEE